MKKRKAKIILWTGIALVILVTVATIAGISYFRRHIPAEIIPDIRSAIAARNVADPDGRLNK